MIYVIILILILMLGKRELIPLSCKEHVTCLSCIVNLLEFNIYLIFILNLFDIQDFLIMCWTIYLFNIYFKLIYYSGFFNHVLDNLFI